VNAVYKFSEGQLNSLKDEYLLNLARYYEIPLQRKLTKDKLIELIIKKQNTMPNFYGVDVVEPSQQENSGMSVRVRRIKELQENKNE
jgi:hypothetical protein